MPRDPLRRVLRTIEGRLLQELTEVEDRFGIRVEIRPVRDLAGRLIVVAIDPATAPPVRVSGRGSARHG